ncbi:class A beta-lactamase [Humibacter ginsenosidimutans]|uniref:class A beta-lactamase n=1 Tax=Humibacter ginsenosidimutans TaxID=2599293 RepID=UPI001FEE4A0D|nr:class A beta-lactamase [Humibacter ginsenosidimutans]
MSALVVVLAGGCSSVPNRAAPGTPDVRRTATATPSAPVFDASALSSQLSQIETRFGARVGVDVLDTGAGTTFGYRATERFALDSTSKVLTSGMVLSEADDARLATVIHFGSSELQSYSPITSQHVDTGMTLSALVAAALQYSDNTAANLLYGELGGPAAAQSRLRAWGDTITNLDRVEPDLNSAVPGDVRDTSTPGQMATALKALLIGDRLSAQRRAFLRDTMLANTTGGPYIRAGVPSTWRVADKTGNGGYGSRNDVAVLYPPGASPIVLTVYTTRSTADAASDDGLIATVTRSVVAALDGR